jgi:hypothetical protein
MLEIGDKKLQDLANLVATTTMTFTPVEESQDDFYLCNKEECSKEEWLTEFRSWLEVGKIGKKIKGDIECITNPNPALKRFEQNLGLSHPITKGDIRMSYLYLLQQAQVGEEICNKFQGWIDQQQDNEDHPNIQNNPPALNPERLQQIAVDQELINVIGDNNILTAARLTEEEFTRLRQVAADLELINVIGDNNIFEAARLTEEEFTRLRPVAADLELRRVIGGNNILTTARLTEEEFTRLLQLLREADAPASEIRGAEASMRDQDSVFSI